MDKWDASSAGGRDVCSGGFAYMLLHVGRKLCMFFFFFKLKSTVFSQLLKFDPSLHNHSIACALKHHLFKEGQ